MLAGIVNVYLTHMCSNILFTIFSLFIHRVVIYPPKSSINVTTSGQKDSFQRPKQLAWEPNICCKFKRNFVSGSPELNSNRSRVL